MTKEAANRCQDQFWSVTLLVWLQIMGSLFQFSWWVVGMAWTFTSTEENCGGLVTTGRPIFFTQMFLYGFAMLLIIVYAALRCTGKLKSFEERYEEAHALAAEKSRTEREETESILESGMDGHPSETTPHEHSTERDETDRGARTPRQDKLVLDLPHDP